MARKADPAAVVARFPGPVTLYPSRGKWLLLFAISLAFAIGGYYMVRDGASGGWFVLIFFGLGVPVAVIALLPGAGRLTLDRDGFEAISMFRGARTHWRDASGFSAVTLPPSSHVMVVYDDARISGMAAATNVKLTGRNAGLPDTYGLKGEQLAAVMESWRERALQRQ